MFYPYSFCKTAAEPEDPLFRYGLPIVAPGISAPIRTYLLNAEDKKLLRKYYNLQDDSNLELRNLGRGIVGGLGSSIALGTIGGLLGGVNAIPLSTTIGAVIGASRAGDKYSKTGVNNIRKFLADRKELMQE